MARVRVTRTITVPDPLRLSRYQKFPELGPKILFFSGGTALNGLCRTLKRYTHNSIHLVTPFDSGGSSAKLRQAFNMPAIGDLRSRLTALADETVTGLPDIFQLFTHRLDAHGDSQHLRTELETMATGHHPLVTVIANPMRRIIRNQLGYFLQELPEDFDLRGASIGNLILAGGYLNNHHHLDPIIFLFSQLVHVQGTVRAIVSDNLHLGAKLENGEIVLGQHNLTGKEVPEIESPIERLFLTPSLETNAEVETVLRKKNRELIQQAELICYPPGSFYSSLMANLLPGGVGEAIIENEGPKVFIPNLGRDPEQKGMTLEQSLLKLLRHLQRDQSRDCTPEHLLNFLLVDSKHGDYPGGIPTDLVAELGMELIDIPMVDTQNPSYYDNEQLVSALMSLT